MNREEKKKYLQQYVELKRLVESLKEECFFWRDKAVSVPIARLELSGVKGSKHKNPVEKHLEVLDLLEQKEQEAADKLEEILLSINTVEDTDQRSVLVYRYVNDLYFYQIAPLMKCGIDNIFKLHRKALDNMKVYSQLQ